MKIKRGGRFSKGSPLCIFGRLLLQEGGHTCFLSGVALNLLMSEFLHLKIRNLLYLW